MVRPCVENYIENMELNTYVMDLEEYVFILGRINDCLNDSFNFLQIEFPGKKIDFVVDSRQEKIEFVKRNIFSFIFLVNS